MKNVIVYYSFSHNNEKLARYLSEKLLCEKLKVETVKSRTGFSIFLDLLFRRRPAVKPLSKTLAAYDHVTFVSPIWAGKIATPLTSTLRSNKGVIGQYSFVSLCGGAPGQKEKIEQELVALLGKKPDDHVQLSVQEAIALHQHDKNHYATTGYRIAAGELEVYEPQLREFVRKHSVEEVV